MCGRVVGIRPKGPGRALSRGAACELISALFSVLLQASSLPFSILLCTPGGYLHIVHLLGLPTFELGSINGRRQEDMERAEEREMELSIHYSFIHSTEGYSTWQVALFYNHRSCQCLPTAPSPCPFPSYWLQKKRGLRTERVDFGRLGENYSMFGREDSDDLV